MGVSNRSIAKAFGLIVVRGYSCWKNVRRGNISMYHPCVKNWTQNPPNTTAKVSRTYRCRKPASKHFSAIPDYLNSMKTVEALLQKYNFSVTYYAKEWQVRIVVGHDTVQEFYNADKSLAQALYGVMVKSKAIYSLD